jgi:uncharacterized protein with HEPN domain
VRRDARVFLGDILEACEKIERYTSAISIEQFRVDEKTGDAVVRNLEVIGEAAKSIPDDIRRSIAGIEWQRIAGLRDVLIHEYFGIDLDIVWNIVETKVPLLHQRIAEYLQSR